MTLDGAAVFAAGDPHGAAKMLADFPRQCRGALAIRAEPPLRMDRPRLLVLAGMGGSAASGDLLAACASDSLDVPVLVHRDYGLPTVIGKDALVIASSYSGNTAEVLSAAEAALSREVPLAVVTVGGALATLAVRHGRPRALLPGGLMPRMALGYLFFPALSLARDAALTLTTEDAIADAVETLAALAPELAPERATSSNEAKQLAVAIGHRAPAVYGSAATGAVAYRWKTDFEENAKVFAMAGAVPEMNHNTIEAWGGTGAPGVHAVLLRDNGEAPEIARRFDILASMIAPRAGGVSECRGRGRTRLACLLSLIYLGQWTSYYLAILRGVDPWSIPLLDELKRRMT